MARFLRGMDGGHAEVKCSPKVGGEYAIEILAPCVIDSAVRASVTPKNGRPI